MTNQDYQRVTQTAEQREDQQALRWLNRGLSKQHFGNLGDRMTVITELLFGGPWPPISRSEGTRTIKRFEFMATTGELLRYTEAYPGEFDPIRIIHGDWYTLDLVIKAHSPDKVTVMPGTPRERTHVIKVPYTVVSILAMRHSPRYEAPWDKAY